MAKKVVKKKAAKIVPKAKIFVSSSFNNTIMTATDENGNVFAWSSTGKAGFKGTKKSTPFAATQTAKILLDKMHESQVTEVEIYVSGVSTGRDAALRALASGGFKITKIKDQTPIPHNGCRAKKPRRV